MKAMRAIIWKELRERAALAWYTIFGMILQFLFMDWATGFHRPNTPDEVRFFLSWTVIVGPLMGAIFGLMQIIPELPPDRWAFLIHRQAARGTIFFGKVNAGLLLYFAAVGVPFAMEALWLAVPAMDAVPLTPDLVQRGITGILLGVVFYFAGMLAALVPARRSAAFITALLCLAIAITVKEFRYVALSIFLFASALLAAAYGCFSTSGSYRLQPRLSRICLAAMSLISDCVLLWFCVAAAEHPFRNIGQLIRPGPTAAIYPLVAIAFLTIRSGCLLEATSWYFALPMALGAAFLAYFIGLRFGWDRKGRLAWAFGIFWLGLPGLLTLLTLDRWPARETCPACGKKRVVTRVLCEHCGAPFAAFKRNGTEIFELEEAA